MKAGRTLTELAQEIERQAAAKKDYVVRSEALEMVPTEAGVALALPAVDEGDDREHLMVNDLAHNQIGSFCGIPSSYYDRMLAEDPELLADNVNRWMRREAKPRMIRTLDGRTRAFLSNSYRPLDYVDMAEAVLPILGQLNLAILSCEVTERRLYLKAVDRGIELDVPTGRRMGDGSHVFFDTLSPAIIISNSEVGCGAMNVETGVWTKVCTNLAIASQRSMRKFHLGGRMDLGEDVMAMLSDETRRKTDAALWSQVSDLVRGAFERARFEAYVKESLAPAVENRIVGDPVKAIEVLGKKQGLNEGERGSVLKHLIDGGDLSQYGVHAAVTRASADVESYDRATALERVGGKILELPRTEWRAIAEAGKAA